MKPFFSGGYNFNEATKSLDQEREEADIESEKRGK